MSDASYAARSRRGRLRRGDLRRRSSFSRGIAQPLIANCRIMTSPILRKRQICALVRGGRLPIGESPPFRHAGRTDTGQARVGIASMPTRRKLMRRCVP